MTKKERIKELELEVKYLTEDNIKTSGLYRKYEDKYYRTRVKHEAQLVNAEALAKVITDASSVHMVDQKMLLEKIERLMGYNTELESENFKIVTHNEKLEVELKNERYINEMLMTNDE